jgi:hypothetical protein
LKYFLILRGLLKFSSENAHITKRISGKYILAKTPEAASMVLTLKLLQGFTAN